jgi:hypothetical protein
MGAASWGGVWVSKTIVFKPGRVIMPNVQQSVDICVNTIFNSKGFNNNVDNVFNLVWCNALKRGESDALFEAIDLVKATMNSLLSGMRQLPCISVHRPVATAGAWA